MKLIFSDIDGTLINDQHQLTEKTKAAIQKRIKKGDLFIPVSARMPQAIRTVADAITKNYPMICYNGALVLDQNKRVIESQTMAIAQAREIISSVEYNYPSIAWNVYVGNQWFSPKMPANLNEEKIVQVKSIKIAVDDLKRLTECHKLLLIGKPTEIDELKHKLKTKFSNLNITKSSPILLEIMAKGVQKGTAVKNLITFFQVPVQATYAFGDNYNDEEMLKVVGHSVAMGNAPQTLKQEVTEVTLDNNHDGIAAVLNKMK